MEIRVQKTDLVAEFLKAYRWVDCGNCYEPVNTDIYVLDISSKRFMLGTRAPIHYVVPCDVFTEFTVLYAASPEAANVYLQEYFHDQ